MPWQTLPRNGIEINVSSLSIFLPFFSSVLNTPPVYHNFGIVVAVMVVV
jgi:hypothetical protein